MELLLPLTQLQAVLAHLLLTVSLLTLLPIPSMVGILILVLAHSLLLLLLLQPYRQVYQAILTHPHNGLEPLLLPSMLVGMLVLVHTLQLLFLPLLRLDILVNGILIQLVLHQVEVILLVPVLYQVLPCLCMVFVRQTLIHLLLLLLALVSPVYKSELRLVLVVH